MNSQDVYGVNISLIDLLASKLQKLVLTLAYKSVVFCCCFSFHIDKLGCKTFNSLNIYDIVMIH